MSADVAVDVVRRAVILALTVAGPMLLAALVVGVVVSLIQAITQIQEQTLTFVPKILTIGAVLVIALPWILTRLVEYLSGSITMMGTIAP